MWICGPSAIQGYPLRRLPGVFGALIVRAFIFLETLSLFHLLTEDPAVTRVHRYLPELAVVARDLETARPATIASAAILFMLISFRPGIFGPCGCGSHVMAPL